MSPLNRDSGSIEALGKGWQARARARCGRLDGVQSPVEPDRRVAVGFDVDLDARGSQTGTRCLPMRGYRVARRTYPPDPLLQRVDPHGRTVMIRDNSTCEAWIGDDWRLVHATDAIRQKGRWVLRCVGCHGPVHAESGDRQGRMLDRIEHDSGVHQECPLYHGRRAGTPTSRSPAPVMPPAGLVGPEARELVDEMDAKCIVGDVGGTERQRLIAARLGQGRYRDAVVARWGSCSVTGAGPTSVLIASHVVPWCKCKTNRERLDPFNGLLLTPNLDKLFDRGLITFRVDGTIRISALLTPGDAEVLGVHAALKLRYVPDETKDYLERHVSEMHFRPQ